ncbi:MAG: hypothetical protein V8S93_13055 [Lachnospiraceae bacterium]
MVWPSDPMSNYDFSEKAIRNIRLTGNLHGTFNSFEWIEADEDEESDSGNGVWIYIDLDREHSVLSAVKRKAEIEAQYAGMRSKKKAAAAIAATVVDGWYEDSNGWWALGYVLCFVNQWETVLGVRRHFNAEGYLDTGWFNADGFWYFAKDSGELLKNGDSDGYSVNEDGVWIP